MLQRLTSRPGASFSQASVRAVGSPAAISVAKLGPVRIAASAPGQRLASTAVGPCRLARSSPLQQATRAFPERSCAIPFAKARLASAGFGARKQVQRHRVPKAEPFPFAQERWPKPCQKPPRPESRWSCLCPLLARSDQGWSLVIQRPARAGG